MWIKNKIWLKLAKKIKLTTPLFAPYPLMRYNSLNNIFKFMKNKILVGSLFIIASALLWSLDGTFLRPNLNALPSVFVVFLEHTLGFIALLPFLIIYRHEIKKISKKQWGTIFWVALFGGALGTIFMTKALFLTGFKDISVVILLQKLQPIFAITLAMIFLHERFPRRFYLYALISVIGGYFVTFKNPLSVFNLPMQTYLIATFALLAAFSWGSSTVFGKYSLKNINYGLLTALRFGFTSLILIIPALYFYHQTFLAINAKEWTTLLIIVFTSGAAAMWLYYYGLKKVPASVATLCEMAWPISAIFFDYFLNHNILSTTQILGSVILTLAVYRAMDLIRPRTIYGTVIHGHGQGKDTGAATANLLPSKAEGLPHGLYTCIIEVGNKNYHGLLYHGHNSLTKEICLEAHLFDFKDNLYDRHLIIHTDKFLRLPKKFNTLAELSKRIKKDLKLFERAREN